VATQIKFSGAKDDGVVVTEDLDTVASAVGGGNVFAVTLQGNNRRVFINGSRVAYVVEYGSGAAFG
jgi:hypothetical protein